MKKIRVLASVLLIIAVLLASINIVFATGVKAPTEGSVVVPDGVENIAGKVLGAGQVICYVAAVILIMWMGVKWLTAAPEGKAEMKKGLIIAAVASALLVGAGVIMNAVGKTISGAVDNKTVS